MNYRAEHEKNNKGKTIAHPRVRGDWVDAPLPFIGTTKANKINRRAIHPAWLDDNPEQDTPSRIQEEPAVGSAAGTEDSESMED